MTWLRSPALSLSGLRWTLSVGTGFDVSDPAVELAVREVDESLDVLVGSLVLQAVALDSLAKRNLRLGKTLYVVMQRFDQNPVATSLLFEPIEASVRPIEASIQPIQAPVHPIEAPGHPIEAPLHPTEALVQKLEAAAHLVTQDLELGTHGSIHSIASEKGQDVSRRRHLSGRLFPRGGVRADLVVRAVAAALGRRRGVEGAGADAARGQLHRLDRFLRVGVGRRVTPDEVGFDEA